LLDNYVEINFKKKLDKIKLLLKWWKLRQLTLYGKAMIINTVILAQVWFQTRIFEDRNELFISFKIRNTPNYMKEIHFLVMHEINPTH